MCVNVDDMKETSLFYFCFIMERHSGKMHLLAQLCCIRLYSLVRFKSIIYFLNVI